MPFFLRNNRIIVFLENSKQFSRMFNVYIDNSYKPKFPLYAKHSENTVDRIYKSAFLYLYAHRCKFYRCIGTSLKKKRYVTVENRMLLKSLQYSHVAK